MATSPTCIIAYTSEDGRYTRVAQAAMDLARAANADLILYDADAATSTMDQVIHPLSGVAKPTEWSGEGADETISGDRRRMGPHELERAGRQAVASQVTTARGMGVEAFGWLPDGKGIDGIADYAEEQGADLIVIPSDLANPGFFQRLRGETLEKAVEKTRAAIAVVGEDGSIDYPAHDSDPHREAGSLDAARRDAGR